MSAHAALKGVSCFAMAKIGAVDDWLERTDVANCRKLIFIDVYCTLTVYTLETGQDFCPIPCNFRADSWTEPNRCAVVTPEEVFLTKSVKERISWTRSDSELVERQRADPATKINILASNDME